jgi:hypothetical protein
MIRIGTCIIAALVFLGFVFMANVIESLVIHQEQYAFIPALTIGYLLGLLRMRAIANHGTAPPMTKEQWMRRRGPGSWSE